MVRTTVIDGANGDANDFDNGDMAIEEELAAPSQFGDCTAALSHRLNEDGLLMLSDQLEVQRRSQGLRGRLFGRDDEIVIEEEDGEEDKGIVSMEGEELLTSFDEGDEDWVDEFRIVAHSENEDTG